MHIPLAVLIVILIAVVAALAWVALEWLDNRAGVRMSETITMPPPSEETLKQDHFNELLGAPPRLVDFIGPPTKKFSGDSHDRRVQRRAHGRQEKTHLS